MYLGVRPHVLAHPFLTLTTKMKVSTFQHDRRSTDHRKHRYGELYVLDIIKEFLFNYITVLTLLTRNGTFSPRGATQSTGMPRYVIRPSVCDVQLCRQYRAKLLNVTKFVSVVEAAEDTDLQRKISNKKMHRSGQLSLRMPIVLFL